MVGNLERVYQRNHEHSGRTCHRPYRADIRKRPSGDHIAEWPSQACRSDKVCTNYLRDYPSSLRGTDRSDDRRNHLGTRIGRRIRYIE